MAKCKFILQLPGGGTIEFPASFSTLDPSTTLSEFFSAYQEATEEKDKTEALEKARTFIKKEIPEQIHGNTVNSLLKTSTSVEELIEKINELVLDLGSYDNIRNAYNNYITEKFKEASKKGEKTSKDAILRNLKQKLSKPRKKGYFEAVGLKGVIGASNLSEERNKMRTKNLENKEFGFSTVITEHMDILLKNMIKKYGSIKDTSIFYGTLEKFTGLAWTSDDVVLYEKDNDLSLFSGIFKREAVKMDPSKLVPIIEALNKNVKFKKYGKIDLDTFDIEKFFKGEVSEKKILNSTFENLLTLGKDQTISKEIDAILNLVAESINPDSKELSKALKMLFWQLNPNEYGRNNLFKQLENIKLIDSEALAEKEYKQKQISFLGMDREARPYHFSQPKVITKDVYETALRHITPNKDIVKFPEGEFGVYGVVTHMFQRGEKGQNVMIYGVYRNQFGQLENLKHEFKAGELTYSKREEPIDPYINNEIIVQSKGALLTSPEPMSAELLKKVVRKGDLVHGNLVIAVYPGVIATRAPDGKTVNYYYKNIKSVYSAKVLEELELEKKITPGAFIQARGSELTAGDFFLSENKKGGKSSYKRVLYTDEENVYAWIIGTGKDEKNAIITAVPKANLVGLKDVMGKFSATEVSAIEHESRKMGSSSASMSSFQTVRNAREGDYLFYEENGEKKFGKILEDDKVLIFDGSLTKRIVKSLANIKDVTFFTTRDISSNYSFFTIRANSYALDFKTQKEATNLDVEMRYVVPAGTDVSTLEMLANNYANIGSYKAATSVLETDVDITEDIIKLLGYKDSQIKVYGKFLTSKDKTSKIYERNLKSLIEIKYFNKLPLQIKRELNALVPGSYFSVYRASDIDRGIYRVMSINGDVVTAQLNRMTADGKIVTTEKEFSMEVLLNTEVDSKSKKAAVGSMGKLYMQEGNNKIKGILANVNKMIENPEDLAATRPTTVKAINTLIKSLKEVVKKVDIKVKLVSPEEGNFQNGQKAKLEVDSDGKASILINSEIGRTEDVVHEFLHLFLTPLRYKHPDIYQSLISSIVENKTLNVTDAEEEFVSFIASKMETQVDFVESLSNFQTFVKGMQTILTDVNEDFLLTAEDNPISLLNTPLMKLFEIDGNDESTPLYNLAMITTEPMMRDWLKNNNISLNCI